MEIWKQIEEYPNYEISSHGRCRNISRNTILKQSNKSKSNDSYIVYTLYNSYGHKQMYAHRLVAMAFIENKNTLNNEINHIDGNKLNNNITNIEWCGRIHNITHSWKNNLAKPHGQKGSKNANAKLNECDIVKIRYLLNIKSIYDIAVEYKVDKSTIEKIKWNKTWKHVK